MRILPAVLMAMLFTLVLGAGAATMAVAQSPRRTPAATASEDPIDALLRPITQWLERANREYQDTVVKGLSVPTGRANAVAPAAPFVAKATTPVLIDQIRAWLGLEPARPVASEPITLASKPVDPEQSARDEDMRRQIEARKLEKERAAQDQRLAADAKLAKDLADVATQQRQRQAEASRIAGEERRKAAGTPQVPPVQAAAPAGQPGAAKPVAPANPPSTQVAQAANPETSPRPATAASANPKPPVDAKPVAGDRSDKPGEPAPRQQPPVARAEPAKAAEPEPARPARQDAARQDAARQDAARMAEAASQTADRVLAKSSDRGRRERHAAASRKGKSKSHSCSQAGALLQKASIYIVKKGDTLWDIARRYYDKGSKYEKIARANEGRISDPDLIFPCQRVYLPGRHAWLWLEYDGTVQEDAS